MFLLDGLPKVALPVESKGPLAVGLVFNKGVWKLSRLNVKQLGLVLRERGGWTEMF